MICASCLPAFSQVPQTCIEAKIEAVSSREVALSVCPTYFLLCMCYRRGGLAFAMQFSSVDNLLPRRFRKGCAEVICITKRILFGSGRRRCWIKPLFTPTICHSCVVLGMFIGRLLEWYMCFDFTFRHPAFGTHGVAVSSFSTQPLSGLQPSNTSSLFTHRSEILISQKSRASSSIAMCL